MGGVNGNGIGIEIETADGDGEEKMRIMDAMRMRRWVEDEAGSARSEILLWSVAG